MTGTRTRTWTKTMAVLEVELSEDRRAILSGMEALLKSGRITAYRGHFANTERIVYDVDIDDSTVRIVFKHAAELSPFGSDDVFVGYMKAALHGHQMPRRQRKLRVEDGRLIRWVK